MWWDFSDVLILLQVLPAARPQTYLFSLDFFLVSACSSCDQMIGRESPTAWDLNLRLRVWQGDKRERAVRRHSPSAPHALACPACSPLPFPFSETSPSCKEKWVQQS